MKVFVDTFSGLDPFSVDILNDEENVVGKILTEIPSSISNNAYLTTRGGRKINNSDGLMLLRPKNSDLHLQLCYRMRGGKGGFGSMLRAQGGKMRKKKGNGNNNKPDDDIENDSFRTLDGRRMKSVRRAKELAKYLEREPEMQKKVNEKKRAKLQSIISAAENERTSKAKYTDTQFLEQCEELVKDVKEKSSSAAAGVGASDTTSTSSSQGSLKKPPKGVDFFEDEDEV